MELISIENQKSEQFLIKSAFPRKIDERKTNEWQ